MNPIPFLPADILLPKTDHEKWAVVACDQFTSQREYWEETENIVGDAPSALRITLPEVYLNDGDTEERIGKINRTMEEYLDSGVFDTYTDTMVLVERTLADGRVRYGLVGAIDLDAYDFSAGSTSMIRATEGTVLSRIPPRVKIRKDAAIEMPHVMLLIDDAEKTVIEPLVKGRETLHKAYDFDLMMGGGHLRGYLLWSEDVRKVRSALARLKGDGENPLLFAVGDGNHSLATAKTCAEGQKNARALVEVVNLHSDALDFEPIYRVMFGVDPEKVFEEAKSFFTEGEKTVTFLAGEKKLTLPASGLVVSRVQEMIDAYLAKYGGEVDYIHGEDVTAALSKKENTVGILFDGISKSELFPYVKEHGALPRKTFSMGEARDKRYYMEARKIK